MGASDDTGVLSLPRRRPAPLERAPLSADELLGLALEPGTRDVARRMLAHGASPEFTRLVVARTLAQGARGAFAVDVAAALLSRALPVLPSPKRPRRGEPPPLIAFVGPTGVGKTTALVKLARKLAASGRAAACASLDPSSAGALAGVIERDVDRGELPITVVQNGEDLRSLLRRARGMDAVLLDTPGMPPRAGARLDELARELARCAEHFAAQTLLVLSAASGPGALRLATEAFAPFRALGAVLTKLDETDEPAAALEALVRARLALAFLCDGQDARAHLVRPGSEALADLVLLGRLPEEPA